MKSVFSINPFVSRGLATSGYDVDKLINSVQSAMNDGVALTAEGEQSKRGNGKLFGKGVKSDVPELEAQLGTAGRMPMFRMTEGTTGTYEGKATMPLRFLAWHDAFVRVIKVHGEPSGEVTADVIPIGLRTWLKDKFAVAPTVQEPVKGSKGNGKAVIA